jgi:4'-phosphopantetheinyl transferase
MLCVCTAEKTKQHEAAHALLWESLKEYGREQGISLGEMPLCLTLGSAGKPSFTEYPEIEFNLSHCEGMAACLISDCACGVDAEGIRHVRPKVAARVFSAEEQAQLAASANPDLLFTQLWTLKESYIKAIGVGLSYPMQTLSFRLEEEGIVSNHPEASFAQLLLPRHVVSVCRLSSQQVQPVIACSWSSAYNS